MLYLLTVNFGVLELPRRHFVLKQDIDLAERTILGFWKTEPAPEVAEQIRSSVE